MNVDGLDKEVTRLLTEYMDNPSASLRQQIDALTANIKRYAPLYDDEGIKHIMSTAAAKAPSRKGMKLLQGGKAISKKLPVVGTIMGLAMSDDVSAAIDPSGSTSMDYDKSFEDPSSPEYAERISLIESLTGKKRKDK